MAAISGHKAKIMVTDATVTTSTNQAATLSTDGITLQINTTTLRHWDIDSTSHPKVYDHSVSTAAALGSSLYSVNYVQGIVSFTAARSTTPTYMVDVHSVTASSWLNANAWAANIDQPLLDANRFGSTWMEAVAGLRNAGVSLAGFWTIGGGSTAPLPFDYIDSEQRVIVELHPGSSGDKYEGYGWIATNAVNAQVDALVGETVDVTIDGTLYFTTA